MGWERRQWASLVGTAFLGVGCEAVTPGLADSRSLEEGVARREGTLRDSRDLMSTRARLPRPFQNEALADLDRRFQAAGTDRALLQGLERELEHRSTKASRELLQRVRRALGGEGQAAQAPGVRATNLSGAKGSVEAVREKRRGRSGSESGEGAPACPLCGSPMRLRTARTGVNAGRQFWGCSKYPACRGAISVDAEPHARSAENVAPPLRAAAMSEPAPLATREMVARPWAPGYHSVFFDHVAVRSEDLPRWQDSLDRGEILAGLHWRLEHGQRQGAQLPSERAKRALSVLDKILHRGHVALLSAELENAAWAAARAKCEFEIVQEIRDSGGLRQCGRMAPV